MSGKKSWEIRWPTRYGVNAADPIIVGNEIWIGSGYGKGHGVYEVKGEETTVRWTNRELRTQQNAPILIDDYLFGFDGDGGSRAALKCVHQIREVPGKRTPSNTAPSVRQEIISSC